MVTGYSDWNLAKDSHGNDGKNSRTHSEGNVREGVLEYLMSQEDEQLQKRLDTIIQSESDFQTVGYYSKLLRKKANLESLRRKRERLIQDSAKTEPMASTQPLKSSGDHSTSELRRAHVQQVSKCIEPEQTNLMSASATQAIKNTPVSHEVSPIQSPQKNTSLKAHTSPSVLPEMEKESIEAVLTQMEEGNPFQISPSSSDQESSLDLDTLLSPMEEKKESRQWKRRHRQYFTRLAVMSCAFFLIIALGFLMNLPVHGGKASGQTLIVSNKVMSLAGEEVQLLDLLVDQIPATPLKFLKPDNVEIKSQTVRMRYFSRDQTEEPSLELLASRSKLEDRWWAHFQQSTSLEGWKIAWNDSTKP